MLDWLLVALIVLVNILLAPVRAFGCIWLAAEAPTISSFWKWLKTRLKIWRLGYQFSKVRYIAAGSYPLAAKHVLTRYVLPGYKKDLQSSKANHDGKQTAVIRELIQSTEDIPSNENESREFVQMYLEGLTREIAALEQQPLEE